MQANIVTARKVFCTLCRRCPIGRTMISLPIGIVCYSAHFVSNLQKRKKKAAHSSSLHCVPLLAVGYYTKVSILTAPPCGGAE